MPFAAGLRESLHVRTNQVSAEISSGDDLRRVLTRHLVTVEAMTDGDLITSILLLSEDGKRLSHCADRGLPAEYCQAIDGAEIGPSVGSCGTAAYFGRPVYVADIASDPLWADYRDLALPHGLASCWSTPIRASDGAVVGTFAVYRRTVGHPAQDEIEAIDLIAEHVADAIVMARSVPTTLGPVARRPNLRLVSSRDIPAELPTIDRYRLLALADRLADKAAELDRLALDAKVHELAESLESTARTTRKLVASLRREFGEG